MSDIAERIVFVMATFVEVLLSEPDLGVDLVSASYYSCQSKVSSAAERPRD
jgi:hypothetical protein